MKNLKRLWLGGTAIKELPSSLDRLVGLEILNLQCCTKLKTIPSSIGNLNKLVMLNLAFCESLETFPEIPNYCLSSLTELSPEETSIENLPESMANLSSLESLDLSYCKRLECVQNNIGHLSSLTELVLQGSSIVNLPESIAHLSSLTSLGLTLCKRLKCVPKLPPNLKRVWALYCPSIKRMMLSSRSYSKEGTFEFYLTNSQELDATSLSNIGEEACIKITDDAYRSVVFCFPGSAVPRWFHYCCKGHSVTLKEVSPNLCSKNRLIGFALCAIWRPGPGYHGKANYKFGFTSDGKIYSSDHYIPDIFGTLNLDHTLLWKHQLDLETIGNKLFHAQNFTFEFPANVKVKECGICPLYTRRIDDNSIEETSGSKAAE
ncbi:hypothetical protein P8452_39502 [Trifolium repens]|nr:hypothetical protein P8452_39502 [Trifolium repens]